MNCKHGHKTHEKMNQHQRLTYSGIAVIRAFSKQQEEMDTYLDICETRNNFQRVQTSVYYNWGHQEIFTRLFLRMVTIYACMTHRGLLSQVTLVLLMQRVQWIQYQF